MLSSRERLPALDGLRGMAILLVLLLHFGYAHLWSPVTWAERAAARVFSIGWSGVDLFFVLSGFLITGILYEARGGARYFQTFYIRRALRIFPLYYVCIAAYVLLIPRLYPDHPWTPYLISQQGWFWLYGSNLINAVADQWSPVTPFYSSTLWSLAVEEQFYFVWPLFILAVQKHHARWCLIICGAALAVRVLLFATGTHIGAMVLMPARMDAFALGGWLAIVGRERGLDAVRTFARSSVMGAGLLILAWWVWAPTGTPDAEAGVRNTVGFSVTAVFFAGCLASALLWPSGVWGRIGHAPLAQWLGRYSYGLYLLHCPVRIFLDYVHLTPPDIVAATAMPRLTAVGLFMLIGISLSAGLAIISWNYLEGPFLSLKDRIANPKLQIPHSKSQAAPQPSYPAT